MKLSFLLEWMGNSKCISLCQVGIVRSTLQSALSRTQPVKGRCTTLDADDPWSDQRRRECTDNLISCIFFRWISFQWAIIRWPTCKCEHMVQNYPSRGHEHHVVARRHLLYGPWSHNYSVWQHSHWYLHLQRIRYVNMMAKPSGFKSMLFAILANCDFWVLACSMTLKFWVTVIVIDLFRSCIVFWFSMKKFRVVIGPCWIQVTFHIIEWSLQYYVHIFSSSTKCHLKSCWG